MRRFALVAGAVLLLAAAPPPPPDDPYPDGADRPQRTNPCAPAPQLYIAAMGQPFRSPAGGPDPMAAWFAQADADRDGRVTPPEFLADAERFFRTLDRDRDGEIDPQEVAGYEIGVAPEIRLYRRGAPLETKRRRNKLLYLSDALGAGRFAQLNIPEPVSSADADYDRGVSLQEFRATAAARFALLDASHAGALTIATLAPTPQQAQARLCAAAAAKDARRR